MEFSYDSASVVAILGSIIALAVTFGLHMTQDNIDSTLKLAGLILGAIAAGGGAKSAALIHGKIRLPSWWHFTPAVIVSAVAEVLTLAVGYGLHVTQQNIDSIQTLVGLVATGLIVGGAVTTNAAIRAAVHPALTDGEKTTIRAAYGGRG